MRILLAVVAVALVAFAQPYDPRDYEKTDVMIPSRDGVRLHSEIWRPKAQTGPLPFLMQRTPYGLARTKANLETSFVDLAREGYIFVFQDIRGRYQSEGQFVMQRPVRDPKDSKAIDEGSDTYDTIEWLLKNVAQNNGRVGLFGISYGGWLTVMALIDPHPALKAASEQASPADMFLGDDFHHNGAFRLSYGYEYASMMETGKENTPFKFDRYDTYDWYLQLGPLREANRKHLDGQRPTWNNFVAHPNYDEFWQKLGVAQYVHDFRVPNLNVAGWFDQEDFYGPVKIYEAAAKSDPQHRNYLVVGPWNHGGWARGDGKSLGKIEFGSNTAEYFREKIQAPWFAYWLKEKGRLEIAPVVAFQTGSNEWRSYEAWPPKKGIATKSLYFQEGGGLSFDPPKGSECDSFVSDPTRPVPYRARPIPPTFTGQGWATWLADDQRFADGRPDVQVWQTEPLTEEVSIAGDVVARFFASTTGTDSDWIVKLIDVYPDGAEKEMSGYQLMIAGEVLRGRFRDGYEHPKPVRSGEVVPYRLDLLTHNHRFLKGHRIMVQMQSSWFPLIDRNPQKFVDNIFDAHATDFIATTQRVCRSKEFPSQIELPVEERQ